MEPDVTKNDSSPKKPPRVPGAKTMKMLSMAQAKNPMKHAYYGGFQNIAFQTGVVIRLAGDPPNQIYLRTDAKAKHPLPIMLPSGVRPPNNGSLVKVTCTVLGATDPQGNPYPILIARMFAIPNVLEAGARRTTDLLKEEADPTETMRKQTGVGNDVHLTGVVVGRRLHRRQRADGAFDENQSATFLLRLDADPTHVIPVICDKKLAEQANNQIRFGSIISVRGQYHTMTIKVAQFDAAGKPVLNEDGSPVYVLTEDGNVKLRYHPYIYLTGYPTNAPNQHLLFTDPTVMAIPEWIESDINNQIRIRAALGTQQNVVVPEPQEVEIAGDALVTKEEFVQTSIPAAFDRDGGL